MHTGFSWGNVRERGHLEDPEVCGRILFKRIFGKLNVGEGGSAWNGLNCFRIGTGVRLL